MKDESAKVKYILGLDLGVASVGWALVPCNPEEISTETLKMGSRVFDPGTDGKLEEGKDESRNVKRRTARGVRRNFWRRRRRAVKLFNILQNAGLLPSDCCHTPEARQKLFNALDRKLFQKYFPNASREEAQTYLYALRAKALDEQLSLEALGRAFYALGQRRGFLSNKKTDSDETDEELGKVKGGIAELEKLIAGSGARTLGEYFAKLDPEENRIRGRWVGRKMFIDEFNAIWDAQKKFYPDILTDALREKVYKAIFYQRPLKSQKGLVSRCELEPSRRCAAKADPLFQEFRYWHRLLDLEVRDPENEGQYRSLTKYEQDVLAEMLEYNEKLSFAEMRKALGFPTPKKKSDAGKFNFELQDGDKEIKGNVTRARIRKALQETGAGDLPTEDVDRIAREILFYDNDAALAAKLETLFPKFSSETAAELSKVRIEPDYGSLSHKALTKVLPLMKEKRIRYATARKELYGEELQERAAGKAVDYLAPVKEALGAVRNPTVERTLTEMRKVVNEIIRRYGKPECIRVELARDLKRGRKDREKIFMNNKAREKDRIKAEEKIRKEMNWNKDAKITKRDVLKYRLWEECGGVCPYTGKSIDLRTLFAEASPVDIEHIIPFSISLDDSFGNKTLCYAEENRNVKRNRTPFQAYGRTDRWNGILERVKKFRSFSAGRKLELFKQEEIKLDAAESRLLNDTRYISKLALRYLDALYGAVNGNDAKGKKRVQIALGDTTAWLRDAWNLNTVLLSADEQRKYDAQSGQVDVVKKNRDDHRHHAVDAVVIALTSPAVVKNLSANAEEFYKLKGRGWFALRLFEPPCTGFREIVKTVVDGITVSRRVERKVSGALHEETNYGKDVKEDKGSWRAIRKPLVGLSIKDIDNICDPKIRDIVLTKLADVGGDPKNFENDPPYILTDSHPRREIPIKTVRYWKNVKAGSIGKRGHERYVASGANHHMEIYAVLDDDGNEIRWETVVVDLMEAYRRVREKEPVVCRDFGPNTRFKFSLGLGEAFTLNDGKTYVVRVISENQKGEKSVSSKLHTDARLSKDILKTKGLIHGTNTLQEKGFAKLYVDVLGDVSFSND